MLKRIILAAILALTLGMVAKPVIAQGPLPPCLPCTEGGPHGN